MHTTCLAVLLSLVITVSAAELPEGVRRIKVLNYADCFELSNAGWFAYVMPHHQAFVKRYPSPPNGVYPEIAGLTLCIWYPKAGQIAACELEPHGTRNNIPSGGSASFTEHWYLLPHPFPAAGAKIDLDNLAAQVAREAR